MGGGQGRGLHETRLTTNSPAVITVLNYNNGLVISSSCFQKTSIRLSEDQKLNHGVVHVKTYNFLQQLTNTFFTFIRGVSKLVFVCGVL